MDLCGLLVSVSCLWVGLLWIFNGFPCVKNWRVFYKCVSVSGCVCEFVFEAVDLVKMAFYCFVGWTGWALFREGLDLFRRWRFWIWRTTTWTSPHCLGISFTSVSLQHTQCITGITCAIFNHSKLKSTYGMFYAYSVLKWRKLKNVAQFWLASNFRDIRVHRFLFELS